MAMIEMAGRAGLCLWRRVGSGWIGGGGGGATGGGTPPPEDDWLGSTPGYAQPLAEHSCWVRDRGREFSRQAGIAPAIALAISLLPRICTMRARPTPVSRQCYTAAIGSQWTIREYWRNRIGE